MSDNVALYGIILQSCSADATKLGHDKATGEMGETKLHC